MQRVRPTARPSRPRERHARRHGPDIPWWHSLIFVVAVLLLATTVLVRIGSRSDEAGAAMVSYRVVDATTGQPLPGASVSVGGQTLTSGVDGVVEVPVAPMEQELIVQHGGYETVYGLASSSSPGEQEIALQIAPSPTATSEPPTPTPEPPTATPVLMAEGDTFRGTVSDADGDPLSGAVVRIRSKYDLTDDDGKFAIEYDGRGTRAAISASGYATMSVPIVADLSIRLERFDVKGVYLIGLEAGDEDTVDQIIDLIDRTELNAVVIDIKDAVVFYDSQVEFFRDAGAVQPIYDAEALVARFKEHGIYVIARQVAFKDPLVAEKYPKLAIRDEETGEPWRGWAGEAWVNPLEDKLYKPNVELAVEAAKLGFDEIQYDYIRFPDGDLSGADFGEDYLDVEKRVGALTTLLEMTRDALRPRGVALSADVFGWMLLVDDDQGIGQRFPDIAEVVDYISPMIYPSHFPEGSIAVAGHPNDFPYETIEISLALGMAKIPGLELKMRPWLQDFSLPGMTDYGAAEIRAQIDATESAGASGWMIWNIDAMYVEGAYKAA